MSKAFRASSLASFLPKSRPVLQQHAFRQPQVFSWRIASIHTVPKLNDPSLLIETCYVNGEQVPAASGQTFDVHDPSSGKKIASCPEFNKQDTEKAIAAATEAFATWKKTLPRERATLLRKWYDEMQKNAADIATLITWEVRSSVTALAF